MFRVEMEGKPEELILMGTEGAERWDADAQERRKEKDWGYCFGDGSGWMDAAGRKFQQEVIWAKA